MLVTRFGPMAQDGDWVLVVHAHYMTRKCTVYAVRVYRGKAYTGVKNLATGKYIHKLLAETIIPENYVDRETQQKIMEDIALHNHIEEGDIVWAR